MKRLLVCLILLVGGVVQAQCPDVDNTTDAEAQRKAQAAYDKADAARNEASSAQCLSQEVLDNIKGLDSYLLGRMVALRQAGEITIASVYERKLNAIQARVGRVAFLIEAQANIRYNDATEVINAAQAALMAADWDTASSKSATAEAAFKLAKKNYDDRKFELNIIYGDLQVLADEIDMWCAQFQVQ